MLVLAVYRYTRLPLIVISVTGNAFVPIIMIRYPTLRKSSTNMLIAQLSFAEFLNSLGTLVPMIYANVVGSREANLHLCLVLAIPMLMSLYVIQTTILFVAIDRLLCLIRPLVYHRMNTDFKLSVVRAAVCLLCALIGTAAQFIAPKAHSTFKNCSLGTLLIMVGVYYWFRHQAKTVVNNAVLATTTLILIAYVILWSTPISVFLCDAIFKASSGETNGRWSPLFAMRPLRLFKRILRSKRVPGRQQLITTKLK
ncbi:unnamed protein product [Anisakis simplex]|uniref:G_PROTEIN_RECEP_F1_2 domain-containing protein n=1 Tax=Anisakis simplex TaxID=6269 RepID=A0A0M3K8X6_ANISI|nr:unnamed protein product [Anisakis simplex]